jgi:hypothetical protein
MSRLLRHPKCKDFPPFSQNSKKPKIITFEYITITAKYDSPVSPTIKKLLKNLRKRSFYKAIEVISDISDLFERNCILQILYSSVTYAENNHYANLLKLWIDDIYIKKIPNPNNFIQGDSHFNYYVVINLGFEYKDLPSKKETLW